MRVSIILIGLGLVLGLPTSGQAVDPDIKCYADKTKETAKYYACRLKAESKAIKKAEAPDYAKCDSKYSEKWQKAESKAGTGVCPTEGDEAAIQVDVQQFVADMVAALDPNAASCAGVEVGGACWFLGSAGQSCNTVCTNAGLSYDAATATYAGSGGTLANCYAVLDALGETSPPNSDVGDLNLGIGFGCGVDASNNRARDFPGATTAGASDPFIARACACQ